MNNLRHYKDMTEEEWQQHVIDMKNFANKLLDEYLEKPNKNSYSVGLYKITANKENSWEV